MVAATCSSHGPHSEAWLGQSSEIKRAGCTTAIWKSQEGGAQVRSGKWEGKMVRLFPTIRPWQSASQVCEVRVKKPTKQTKKQNESGGGSHESYLFLNNMLFSLYTSMHYIVFYCCYSTELESHYTQNSVVTTSSLKDLIRAFPPYNSIFIYIILMIL